MDQELISYLDRRFDSLETSVKGLQDDINGIRIQVKGLQEDVSGIKTDVKGLQEDVSGIKIQVKGLQEDVSGIKIEVKGLQEDVKELKKDTHETRILLEDLQDKVQLVAEGLTGVVESFKTHRAEVSAEIKGIRGLVQQSYSDLDRRVRILEGSEIDH